MPPSTTCFSDRLLHWLDERYVVFWDCAFSSFDPRRRIGISIAEAAKYLGVAPDTACFVLKCDDRFVLRTGYWRKVDAITPPDWTAYN